MGNKIKLNTPKKFAQFVKWKRQQLGWSQTDLATRAFGPKSTHTIISNIEQGTSITLITMDKILAALGSDVEFKKF